MRSNVISMCHFHQTHSTHKRIISKLFYLQFAGSMSVHCLPFNSSESARRGKCRHQNPLVHHEIQAQDDEGEVVVRI